MKNKKWLIALLTACTAFSALGLVACKKEKEEGKNPPPVVETTANTLTLSASAKTLDRYESFTLSASLKDADGKKVNGKVSWSSSNTAVATVDGGYVTAQGVGETTITATVDGLSKTCVVTVEDSGALPVLALEDDELALLVDKNYEMGAVVLYKRAEQSDATYTYAIDNTNIATVDANGNITTKACGETTITVTASWRGVQSTTLTQTAKLIVKENIKLSLSAEQTTIATANTTVEGTQYYNSVALDVEFLKNEVAETLDSSKCTWTSSEESVAIVDENGVVTAVGAEGETEILLTYTLDTGVYTSNAFAVTVSVPTVDKTNSICVDLDANADTIANCLTAEKVFGTATTITSVRATTDLSTDIYTDNAWLAEKDQGDEEERTHTLKVYNEVYAYLVKAFVATKVITTASELANLIDYATQKTAIAGVGDYTEVETWSYNGYFVLANNLTYSATDANNNVIFNNAPSIGTANNKKVTSIGSINQVNTNGTVGFHGVFDGRGYTIDGFTYDIGGIFGVLGDNAVIKNVAFTNCTVGDKETTDRQEAVIAQMAYASVGNEWQIENVYMQGVMNGATSGMMLGYGARFGKFSNVVTKTQSNWTSDRLGAIAFNNYGSLTYNNVTSVYVSGDAGRGNKEYKPFGIVHATNTFTIAEYEQQSDGTIKKITAIDFNGTNYPVSVTLGDTATVADFNGYDSNYWTVTAGHAPVFKTKA